MNRHDLERLFCLYRLFSMVLFKAGRFHYNEVQKRLEIIPRINTMHMAGNGYVKRLSIEEKARWLRIIDATEKVFEFLDVNKAKAIFYKYIEEGKRSDGYVAQRLGVDAKETKKLISEGLRDAKILLRYFNKSIVEDLKEFDRNRKSQVCK